MDLLREGNGFSYRVKGGEVQGFLKRIKKGPSLKLEGVPYNFQRDRTSKNSEEALFGRILLVFHHTLDLFFFPIRREEGNECIRTRKESQ